jgi:hypothetical protein
MAPIIMEPIAQKLSRLIKTQMSLWALLSKAKILLLLRRRFYESRFNKKEFDRDLYWAIDDSAYKRS